MTTPSLERPHERDIILKRLRRKQTIRHLNELIRIGTEQPDTIQPLSVQNLEIVRDKLISIDNN